MALQKPGMGKGLVKALWMAQRQIRRSTNSVVGGES
jgi:hypothetical protein